VFVRCRPLVTGEMEKGARPVVKIVDEASMQVLDGKGKAKEFTFDGVLGPRVDQEELFQKVKGLVGSVVDGYNVTIFAYGQTGSGKTYTMAGGGNDGDVGIIPRAIKELFNRLKVKEEQYDFTIKCYFVELYVNKLIDLLAGRKEEGEKLEVKLDAKRMVYVKNAKVVEVEEEGDLIDLWAKGEELRNVTSTKMNDRSSRSHSVLSVVVETRSRATGATTTAKMSLIDLAGSERVKKSGVVGEAFKEALSINKSLSVLSDVISALSNENKFVPYRNNKLTQLMQDSLGGNSKTLMIVGVSPSNTEMEETLMSLHYATRARLIQNKSVKGKGSVGGGRREGDEGLLAEKLRRMEKMMEKLQEENSMLEKRALKREVDEKEAKEGEMEEEVTPA
jgi:kinesin family member C2/C3